MKNPGRMENVTRRLVATLLSLSMVILFASASQAAINCTQCHGNGSTSALPIDTLAASPASYRNITTGAVKGNHGTHSGPVATGAACAKCHGAAAASYPSNHAIMKHYSIQMAAGMNYNKGAGVVTAFKQTATPTLGACSTVNCHFETITPTWGATPFSSTSDCSACHAATGASLSPAHNKHASYTALFNFSDLSGCANCHSNYASPLSFSHATSAVNGTSKIHVVLSEGSYDGSGINYLPSQSGSRIFGKCSTLYCHSQGTSTTTPFGGAPNVVSTWNTTLDCKGCHSFTAASGTAIITGKHTAHINDGTIMPNISCNACHVSTTSDGTTVTTPANHVNRVRDVTIVGTYDSDVTPANNYSAGSCSNVYCHSDGQATPTYKPILWTATISDCTSCHGFVAGGTPIVTGKHTAHINDGTIMPNIACSACHVSTTSNGTTITGAALHVNKLREVTITGTYDSDVTPANNYSASTCSNVYCHSDGQATPTYKPVLWSATIADCKSCHNYDLASGTVMATGSHTEHVNNVAVIGTNFGCQDCHSTTTSNGTTVTTPGIHVDKTRNVSMVTKGGGTWTSPNCTLTYCHSTGQATPAYVNAPAWGNTTDLTCKGCHGAEVGSIAGEPRYANGAQPAVVENNDNSHAAHVANATDCVVCHVDTVSAAGTAIKSASLLHTNQARNVNFAPAYDTNGGTNSDNYTPGTKTCSGISCHGGGTPMWGGATLLCDQCHLSNNTLPGNHSEHYGVAAVAVTADKTPSNDSTASTYDFSCAVCHNGVSHADSNVQVSFDATVAGGGTYTAGASQGADSSGIVWTAGTCSANYCHSDGNGGAPKKTAFNWASPNNTLRCQGCHASQDWKLSSVQPAYSSIRTQAHARHVRGDINTELNVGNGLTCNRCHGATVTAAMNSYSTVNAGVLNKKRHVNALRDYSGVTTNPNGGSVAISNGQFNPSTHQCSNVYCHSNSKVKNPRIGKYANPELWNSGATLRKCNYCHGRQGHGTPVAYDSDTNFSRYSSTGVPNYTSGLAGYSTANSHRQHMTAMGTTDYSNTNVCYSCHAQTLDSTTGRSASAAKFRAYSSRHTSGAYNVKMKALYGGNYNSTMGTKTCSATLCHGGVSPKWGANTTNDSCTKCHGTPSATVIAATKYLIAPPFNTSQGTGSATGTGLVSNDPKVGAHQTHLRFTNGFSNYSVTQPTFMCENCHGTALPTDTAHITGNSAPTFQRLANKNGTTGATWMPASLTCSNTYCHNPAGTGGTLNAGNVGSRTFVSWTATTYLGDTRKTAINCNRCHLSPKDAPGEQLLAGTSHSTVKILDDCSGCHGHNGDANGPVGRRHIDGIKYGGGGTSCDGCHSYADWSSASHNFGGQGQGIGAHQKHINHLTSRLPVALDPTNDYSVGYGLGSAGAVCGACHSNTLSDHSTGDSTAARSINFAGSATYKFGPNAPIYNGVYNASSATNPKSCSNVSCHYFTSPNWSNF
ncbi:MAG: CxxxxCH/CxxCH domain-containing protein [Desulfuromonadaceae bacterium]